jgi:hypothetical protein
MPGERWFVRLGWRCVTCGGISLDYRSQRPAKCNSIVCKSHVFEAEPYKVYRK